ncbi:hypothetical protein RFI_19323, partial [Reticulomyxa filosa]
MTNIHRNTKDGTTTNDNDANQLETTNQCNPVIVQFSLTQSSSEPFSANNKDIVSIDHTTNSTIFPLCTFYDRNQHELDANGTGCFVWKVVNNTQVMCACYHLTYFVLSSETFQPRVHFVTKTSVRDFNAHNLLLFPSGWIVVIVLVAVIIMLYFVTPTIDDQPLIAHGRGVYKQFRDKHWSSFRGYHERNITTSKDLNPFFKLVFLTLLALRCEHPLLSLFFRYKGSGYLKTQRLGALLTKWVCIVAISGFFFGASGHK